MAIGREPLKKVFRISESKWKTAITKIEPDSIRTRGYAQEDLISNISYSEMVYLLLKGELPSKKEAKILNYILISFCDHGLTPPSTQAVRLVTSSGSPLNAAISSALLSFGKNHAGAIEEAMKLFKSAIEDIKSKTNSNNNDINKAIKSNITSNNDINEAIEKIAKNIVNESLNKNIKLPGFGHRYHEKDPRAVKILELADNEDYLGLHIKLALAIEKILFNEKKISLNIDGVNAALLLDMDFDTSVGTGIFMIGRLPALIAHAQEENNKETFFRKFCQIDDVSFLGSKDKKIEKND